MGVFLLSCNSRSSEVFVGSSFKLKSNGDLILLFFLHAISSYMLCTHVELHQSPYFIMHFKFFIRYVKSVYELQDIGGDLHDSTLQMCIVSKAKSSLCTSSGGVLLYLAIKFLNIEYFQFICLSPLKT